MSLHRVMILNNNDLLALNSCLVLQAMLLSKSFENLIKHNIGGFGSF